MSLLPHWDDDADRNRAAAAPTSSGEFAAMALDEMLNKNPKNQIYPLRIYVREAERKIFA